MPECFNELPAFIRCIIDPINHFHQTQVDHLFQIWGYHLEVKVPLIHQPGFPGPWARNFKKIGLDLQIIPSHHPSIPPSPSKGSSSSGFSIL